MVDLEPGFFRGLVERVYRRARRRLGDSVAGAADEERGEVIAGRVATGHIGVQAFDPVGQALRHKEIERAVGRWRLRAQTRLAHPVEHLVGAQGLSLRQKRL